jgi:outer membrane protein OmpA-like peptidoglycan-associated protein
LAKYLASGSQEVPKTFVFDHLNFESASTQLTPGSGQTVNDLATVLKAYPNARIQLAGHTDNTGSPQDNQQLSQNRSDAVKAMLVNNGVSSDRISTVGYGQGRPLTSNDTEDGRAKNRRTELTVTSK